MDGIKTGKPGLKHDEFVGAGKCSKCGQPFMQRGVSMWRVIADRYVVDHGAIQRAVGLEMQIGQLASIMGPDDDLAHHVQSAAFWLCEPCAIENHDIAVQAFK